MNIKEVKDLIQEILQSDISEFEFEHTGTRVKLRRGLRAGDGPAAPLSDMGARSTVAERESVASPTGLSISQAVTRAEVSPEEGLHIIISPIVGTFYRAPAPGAEPFVKIGSKIDVGTILCIVEAMKLMNEIPSDVAGEVVEIFVENSQPVEYAQKLFGIRPRK